LKRSVIIRALRIFVFAAAMLSLLGACSSTRCALAAESAIEVTTDDGGRSIVLAPGQGLIVRLAGNRTTGFGWALADGSGDVVEQQGQPDYVLDAVPGGRVGVGGADIWKFKAMRNGRQTLRFEYRRPWEKGAAPVRTVSYSITVQ